MIAEQGNLSGAYPEHQRGFLWFDTPQRIVYDEMCMSSCLKTGGHNRTTSRLAPKMCGMYAQSDKWAPFDRGQQCPTKSIGLVKTGSISLGRRCRCQRNYTHLFSHTHPALSILSSSSAALTKNHFLPPLIPNPPQYCQPFLLRSPFNLPEILRQCLPKVCWSRYSQRTPFLHPAVHLWYTPADHCLMCSSTNFDLPTCYDRFSDLFYSFLLQPFVNTMPSSSLLTSSAELPSSARRALLARNSGHLRWKWLK
jgi:hypothetical protein